MSSWRIFTAAVLSSRVFVNDLVIASLAFVFAAQGLRVALQMYFALLAPFFRAKLVDPLFLHFLFFFGSEEVGVALLSLEV